MTESGSSDLYEIRQIGSAARLFIVGGAHYNVNGLDLILSSFDFTSLRRFVALRRELLDNSRRQTVFESFECGDFVFRYHLFLLVFRVSDLTKEDINEA